MFELILLPVLMSGAAILAHIHQKPPERLSILATGKSRLDPQPNFSDTLFADQAVKSGIYGLLLGSLAIEKTGNPEIRAFAERTVQVNQKIILELTSMAERKGIQIEKRMDPDQRRNVQRLSCTSGPGFDGNLMTEAASDHGRKIRIFQRELECGTDKDLVRFAADTIVRLKSYSITAANSGSSSS